MPKKQKRSRRRSTRTKIQTVTEVELSRAITIGLAAVATGVLGSMFVSMLAVGIASMSFGRYGLL